MPTMNVGPNVSQSTKSSVDTAEVGVRASDSVQKTPTSTKSKTVRKELNTKEVSKSKAVRGISSKRPHITSKCMNLVTISNNHFSIVNKLYNSNT